MRNKKPLVGILSLFAAACHHLDVATKLFVSAFAGFAVTKAGGAALGTVNAVLALSYVVFFWHCWEWFSRFLVWFGQVSRRLQETLEALIKRFARASMAQIIRWMRRIGGWFK